nr:hypothetical protein [uncultured Agathobaculum sp.]
MKLKDKIKPKIPPLKNGIYMAVCVAVADIGDQYSAKFKNIQRKILFAFDIPSETIEVNGEIRPRQLSKRCTFTDSNRGTLIKVVNAWLNSKISERELRDMELYDFAGKPCQIRVSVREDGVHNDVEDVMALSKGMTIPTTDTPIIFYDIDEDGFSGDKWDALPQWLQDVVKKSEQYQKNPPDKPLDMPADQAQPITGKDDCPI